MKKFLKITFISVLFLAAGQNYAAGSPVALYFKSDADIFAPGSEFSVAVLADSKNLINAFDIEIEYPVSILEFISFNNANSIIEFWVKNPQTDEAGIVKFQGGTSKGFSGDSGELVKLNFRAKKENSANMAFKKADAYLADGLGTLSQTTVKNLNLEVSANAALLALVDINDKKPPVILNAEIAENPAANSRLVIFNAVDKESGLKTVFMRSRKWLFWDKWLSVSNPALLNPGVWTAQLKAVDNGDNSTTETIYIWPELGKKTATAFVLALLVILFVKLLFRKKIV